MLSQILKKHTNTIEKSDENIDISTVLNNAGINKEESAKYMGIEIVENPEEVQVEFPIKLNIENDINLPFFRSLDYKIKQIFN